MEARLTLGLAGLHLMLIGALISASMPRAAQAQGVNNQIVVKPTRALACPSGWRTPDGDTSRCEPQGSLAPKIYIKKESESCASGYFEVYRLWCSTKRP